MDRVTHAYDGPLALFLIGVRVHKPWKLRIVKQVGAAMPKMIAQLEENKAAAERGEAEHLGYLGSRTTLDLSGPTVIQWWRSVEDIYAYANATPLEHRPAWVEFYRVAKGDPGAVTIWHETYTVPPGGVESIYSGPKPFGLAGLSGTMPVGRRGETARERMGRPGAA
ncbi:monooxygenase family protein [Oryzobacter telluris]|uniref:monooxygenase family protein n=1 Tax=Oryzobacter telluris TaxID=3149179 RepID=UPI00370D8AFB